jgi:hypothetical protein
MTKLRSLDRSPCIYNVPGVEPIHLAPKGHPGSESAPFAIGPLGLGPEVESAQRARPPRVAVDTE